MTLQLIIYLLFIRQYPFIIMYFCLFWCMPNAIHVSILCKSCLKSQWVIQIYNYLTFLVITSCGMPVVILEIKEIISGTQRCTKIFFKRLQCKMYCDVGCLIYVCNMFSLPLDNITLHLLIATLKSLFCGMLSKATAKKKENNNAKVKTCILRYLYRIILISFWTYHYVVKPLQYIIAHILSTGQQFDFDLRHASNAIYLS